MDKSNPGWILEVHLQYNIWYFSAAVVLQKLSRSQIDMFDKEQYIQEGYGTYVRAIGHVDKTKEQFW